METGTSEIDRLRAALLASEAARQEAEQHATGAEAMVAHLKLLIARRRQDRFGASSERGRRLLDQLELELEDLETAITEDDAANAPGAAISSEAASERQRPARRPFPADLPRERVIIPAPAQCPCCGSSRLAKLGESVTETLEVIPRRFKVIQTVREKFSCRDCESITQPPAPFHPIARGRAGSWLLSTILTGKFADHLPLNRQSEAFAREGIDLDTSTLADWVGACTATLAPLIAQVRAHVLAAERLHGDDTTVPVLAKSRTVTGRLWTYVRDDRPFGGPAPPAAWFRYSRDRKGEHPTEHLAGWSGILQSDAYGGYNRLFDADRKPAPVTSAGCWAPARRGLFKLAELGRAPLAVEAVRRIDAIFEAECTINGATLAQRLAVRQERVAPMVNTNGYRHRPVCAHFLSPIDRMVSGRAARLFQAEQAASMMCSMPSKTVLDSQLARRNCQTFSTGFSSGARDGRKIRLTLRGILSLGVVCHPARSSRTTAWAPRATQREISSMCSCMLAVPVNGSARPAALPRAGQIAPNSQAFS
ncbi:hypothetical protein SXCC_00619 [Gluconacetobacter sp. SXCC-1]|nr:hypothetical protein SXCC_00619 [Gluconacetobacter sp. SXCC-1]